MERQGLMRVKQVLQVFPVSRTTWWNGVKKGTYPAAIHLGPRMTAWKTSDILDLIERLDAKPVSD